MSVDINVDDDELDEMDDIEDAEIVEVGEEDIEVLEEEEVTTKPIKAGPPPGMPKKKPRSVVKWLMVIAVIIVLIVVGMYAFLYFQTGVTDIYVSAHEDSNNPDQLEVIVQISTSGMGSIAGKADLELTFAGSVLYTTQVDIDDDGNGVALIPLTSFVEENGNYYVTVKYQGKESASAEYTVDYLVEKVEIGFWDEFNSEYVQDLGVVSQGSSLQGQLNVSVHLRDENGNFLSNAPRDVIVTVDEIRCTDSGGPTLATDDESDPFSEHDYVAEYPFSQVGNYTITVTCENTIINPSSGSDLMTVTETWTGFLNIIPEAKIEITNINDDPLTTYIVDFDAGSSYNDGSITNYIWDFNNDGTIDLETTNPTASWEYSIIQDTYTCILNVEGDVTDPLTTETERGAAEITVYTPE